MRLLTFRNWLGLVAALAVSGCNPLPAVTPEVATTTALPTTLPPTPTMAPTLSLTQLQNSPYPLDWPATREIPLVNGEYGPDAEQLSLRLLEPTAFGDLNGDGLEDAAVLVAQNTGGTGTFVFVQVVLNAGGQPRPISRAIIDDRPLAQSLTIENGQIVLGAVIHGMEDPMCCPTFPVSETYQLAGEQLVLVNVASQTPTGLPRRITLTSPAFGSAVAGTLQLQGNVTIAPFENNLVYRLYDAEDNLLAEGPLTVNAPDLGAPGTFDQAVDVSGLPANALARVVVLDLSAADGSVLALAGAAVNGP